GAQLRAHDRLDDLPCGAAPDFVAAGDGVVYAAQTGARVEDAETAERTLDRDPALLGEQLVDQPPHRSRAIMEPGVLVAERRIAGGIGDRAANVVAHRRGLDDQTGCVGAHPAERAQDLELAAAVGLSS